LVPSFVLTRQATAALLARSRARDAALYGEWPALLVGLAADDRRSARRRGAGRAPRPADRCRVLDYVECRGLDWETPDRDRAGVRRVGLAAWRRRMETAVEWELRRRMCARFVRGFERTLSRAPVPAIRLRRAAALR
jgi:hypothetical protein